MVKINVEHGATPVPAMTNAERQRRFQAAHPGYDRLRKGRQRDALKRRYELYRAAQIAEHQAAIEAEKAAKQAQILTIPIPTQLCLPAPVEVLVLPLQTQKLEVRLQNEVKMHNERYRTEFSSF